MHVIREVPRERHRLESWKEIAAFFNRDERTVKRWEKDKGLPVHRIPENTGARVFAYSDELTQWMNAPKPAAAPAPAAAVNAGAAEEPAETSFVPPPRSRKRLILLAAGAALFCAALIFTHARELKHQSPESTTSAGFASTARPHRAEADPLAKQLYLSGRYHWDKRTPDDLNQAVNYFNQAIARDPGYVDAYVGLANCYNLLREFAAMPPEDAFPRALAAARKATELDSSSAEAHTALAFVTFYWNWDAAEAEHEFQRALALDPNYVTAHHWYATFLMVLGRSSEALEEISLAQQLDPASTPILADKALILFHHGDTEQAITLLRQLADSQPAFFSIHQYLSLIYLDQGNDPGYLQEATKAAELSRNEQALAIVRAADQGYRAGGRQEMLRNILQTQKKYFEDGSLSAFDIASTCSRLSDVDGALRYLRLSFHRHEVAFLAIRVHESFVPLHNNHDFQQLVADAGLPPLP